MAELGARAVYVAGVAESALGLVPDQSELSMIATASREALAEAGMTLRDVDAIFAGFLGGYDSIQVGEYLGIEPRFADTTDLGGASYEAYVHHAMLAIAAGRCQVALLAYASRQRTKRKRSRVRPVDDTLMGQFEAPYGLPRPIGNYALTAARHMYEYGTTPEQLAEVAVAARRWAQLNPKAWVREPLAIADVMQSPMVCDPLRKLDCCLVTDGGGAIVVTSGERARNAAKKAIRVLGAGEAHAQHLASQTRNLTTTPGVVSAREAFGMAGITVDDVDVFEPYDAFTINVILHLEDVGFCPKGQGGPFVEGGRLGPGGELPSITSGGGLSYNHPGVLGLLLLVEAVRQLRHEAGARQVPACQVAVAHGLGGYTSSACATVVLGRE